MQNNKRCFPFALSCIKLSRLLILWILGMVLGAVAGSSCSAASISWMHRALSAPVSIFSLFICGFFPFAFTAAAVFFGRPWLIYFLCIYKAFAFAYTGGICLICFGSAGWLVRIFLLFTQITTAPALWYVWLSLCRGKKEFNRRGIAILLLYIASIALLDYYNIAPYLSELSA